MRKAEAKGGTHIERRCSDGPLTRSWERHRDAARPVRTFGPFRLTAVLPRDLSDQGKTQSGSGTAAPFRPVEGREDALPVAGLNSGAMIDDA